jgi:hypothetical protein
MGQAVTWNVKGVWNLEIGVRNGVHAARMGRKMAVLRQKSRFFDQESEIVNNFSITLIKRC